MDSIKLYMENFEKIQKGIVWLKNEIEYSDEKIQKQKQNIIDEKTDSSFFKKISIKKLDRILKLKFDITNHLPVFALGFFDNQMVENFKKSAENEKVWDSENIGVFLPSEERLHFWNFLYEMGFSSNKHFLEYFKNFKNDVTVVGQFWNENDQVCLLRLLIALEPQSSITQKVLRHSLDNNFHLLNSFTSSIFILALTELNYSKYSEIIKEGLEFIKSKQNEDGSWNERHLDKYETTYFTIKAICRINGNNDEQLKKAVIFLLNNQKTDGSWAEDKWHTSYAIISLLLVSPPVSMCLEESMFNKILQEQRMNRQKPYFVHTSPIYDKKLHVNEIHEKILKGINNAKNTIRIVSPYIDMLYEEIINIKYKKPSIDIKIITRPRKDIGGMRKRIANNVLDLLKISTNGNLKTLEVIHSRMVIIDETELIISSADLTREGLFDEFNAGIFTNDEEAIKNSIDYFENIVKNQTFLTYFLHPETFRSIFLRN